MLCMPPYEAVTGRMTVGTAMLHENESIHYSYIEQGEDVFVKHSANCSAATVATELIFTIRTSHDTMFIVDSGY